MIRVIVREQDRTGAVHAGGDADTSFRTFVIEAPELEAWLSGPKPEGYITRQVMGVEVVPSEECQHG